MSAIGEIAFSLRDRQVGISPRNPQISVAGIAFKDNVGRKYLPRRAFDLWPAHRKQRAFSFFFLFVFLRRRDAFVSPLLV